MRRPVIYITACLSLLLAASCRKEESMEIASDYVRVNARMEEGTRLSVQQSVPTFRMFAFTGGSTTADYMYNETMTQSGYLWTSEKKHPLVSSGTEMTFWGIAPATTISGYSAPSQSSARKFSYTCSTTASNQKDIIVGYSRCDGYDGDLEMNFKHIMAGVRFRFGNGVAYSGSVTSVKLESVYSKGTYTPGTGWSGLGTTATYTVNVNKSFDGSVLGADITGTEPCLYLIPQNKSVKVTVATGSGSRSVTQAIDLREGYITTIKINL